MGDIFGMGAAQAAMFNAEANKHIANVQKEIAFDNNDTKVELAGIAQAMNADNNDTRLAIAIDNNDTKEAIATLQFNTWKDVEFKKAKTEFKIAELDAKARMHESDNNTEVRLEEIKLAGRELDLRETEILNQTSTVDTTDFLA